MIVGRQKAAANALDEERMLVDFSVIQHLTNKRIEQSQKERSSSRALYADKILQANKIVNLKS